MEKKNLVFGFIFILVLTGMIFVLATSTATDLIIESNASSNYDEGVFTVNWTAGGDAAANYTIHLWMNDNYISATPNANTSATGYAWSNTTEANYTFTIEAVNATGIGINSTANVSMYVDNTAPLVNWTGSGYTNATIKKNTETLTLNITIGDLLSGIYQSGCIFDINGTNQTVMMVGGFCNTTTLALTGFSDGNHTIDVYANDTVNNIGFNLSRYVVWIDSTAPVATLSCSPSSVTRGNTVTCTCSGTDSGSGINDSLTSAATTPSTASLGTFTATGCSVTDYAGNSDTAIDTYTVTSTSTSGGGTAPTYGWALQKKHSWSKITPGAATIMKDFDKEIGLKQIQIEVQNEAQNVKITVSKYDGKPANVSVEKSGKVYKYLHINAENLEGKLNKAIIRMQLEKSWMIANGFEIENIVMFKFNENSNKWDELNTIYTEADDDYYYYDAEVDSFSYFAISEKVLLSEEETETPDEEGISEEKGLKWWGILLIVLAGLIVVYIVYIKKKKILKLFKKR